MGKQITIIYYILVCFLAWFEGNEVLSLHPLICNPPSYSRANMTQKKINNIIFFSTLTLTPDLPNLMRAGFSSQLNMIKLSLLKEEFAIKILYIFALCIYVQLHLGIKSLRKLLLIYSCGLCNLISKINYYD